MNLSDEVRNFDQIKVGDLVTLTMQAIALGLRKVANNGVRERVDSENAVVAKPGEKPGVMVEKSVRVVANVVAVNKAQTVTLRRTEAHGRAGREGSGHASRTSRSAIRWKARLHGGRGADRHGRAEEVRTLSGGPPHNRRGRQQQLEK